MVQIRRYRHPETQVLFEKWFDTYADVTPTIDVEGVVCKQIFEAPAFRFKGAFSGGTMRGQIMCVADDGSYSEPGRQKDIRNQKAHLEAKEDKIRHDTLAESFNDFDPMDVTVEKLFGETT